MSSGEVRKVSLQDIQLVQNLIERCLQLYMSQKEVIDTLLVQAKIEPGFTKLVWQKLEEENQEFFKAYHLRLIVKEQIVQFNDLLAKQVDLMRKICPTGVSPMPMSNGSHIPPSHQNSACYGQEHTGPAVKAENMHQPTGTGLANNTYTNGGPSMHPCMQTAVDMSAHARRIDVPPSMLLAQSSNVGIMQGMNGSGIKSEAGGGGYVGNSDLFMFGSDGNVPEMRPAIADSTSVLQSNSQQQQQLSEELIDLDSSTFGFLTTIPRNFSLSDLTAHFSNSSDIMGSYSRSPFLATEPDNYLDHHHHNPHGRGGDHQGENKRLDTISEGLSYEDFGSD